MLVMLDIHLLWIWLENNLLSSVFRDSRLQLWFQIHYCLTTEWHRIYINTKITTTTTTKVSVIFTNLCGLFLVLMSNLVPHLSPVTSNYNLSLKEMPVHQCWAASNPCSAMFRQRVMRLDDTGQRDFVDGRWWTDCSALYTLHSH